MSTALLGIVFAKGALNPSLGLAVKRVIVMWFGLLVDAEDTSRRLFQEYLQVCNIIKRSEERYVNVKRILRWSEETAEASMIRSAISQS